MFVLTPRLNFIFHVVCIDMILKSVNPGRWLSLVSVCKNKNNFMYETNKLNNKILDLIYL